MKVLLCGFGLMGKKVYKAIKTTPNFELIGVVSNVFDEQIPEPMYEKVSDVKEVADCVIDFSHPANLTDILNYGVTNKAKLVIATTGLSADQIKEVEAASEHTAIFQSYNTSFGVQMVTKIVREVVKEFYENGFDIEILEKHHNKKIDAPSGTAKLIYEVMEEEVEELKPVYDRSSLHQRREHNEVGIQSMRGGTIFGEHTIMFAGNDEIIELSHTALSKEVFAQGAIAAAKNLQDKEKGLYNLKTLY